MGVVMPQVTPLLAQDAGEGAAEHDAPHERSEYRNNLFVVAALSSATASGPVRIRNMSPHGALIEGPALPPEGTPLRLSRGSLSVTGHVVWRRDNRAGVRFDCAVSVVDWLPNGRAATGQQKVDEIVHTYKSQKVVAGTTALPGTSHASRDLDLGPSLVHIRSALTAAAEELASDQFVAARHIRALQTIDAATQELEKLANQLAAGPRIPVESTGTG
jgi:hypothetical protein